MPYCPSCGGEVADSAKFCTHCGVSRENPPPAAPAQGPPVNQQQDDAVKKGCAKWGVIGCGGLFGLFLLVIIISAVSGGSGDDSGSDDPTETRWERCFDPWDGNHVEFERLVKNALKAPSTFKHVETTYSTGSFPRRVVMRYEAANSFGVPLSSTAIGQSDINCNVSVISVE